MIAEKENGLLLTAGDVDGLVSASVSLMADEGLRRAMGGRGEEIVNEKFNIHVSSRQKQTVLFFSDHLRYTAHAACNDRQPRRHVLFRGKMIFEQGKHDPAAPP